MDELRSAAQAVLWPVPTSKASLEPITKSKTITYSYTPKPNACLGLACSSTHYQ